jgi:hypothetical protein
LPRNLKQLNKGLLPKSNYEPEMIEEDEEDDISRNHMDAQLKTEDLKVKKEPSLPTEADVKSQIR